MAGVRLTGGAELNALGRELRAVGGDTAKGLRKRLRGELKQAAEPIRADLKQAILSIPTKPGGKSSGLRKRMARAVKIRVTTSGRSAGVRVVVDSKALAKYGQQRLPALLDGRKDFRHPTYGHTRRWVSQKPHPYTPEVRRKHQDAAHDAAIRAIETITHEIERG